MAGPAAYAGPPPTIVLDTEVEYSGSTYDLVVVRSGGIDKARVDSDGNWIGGNQHPASYGEVYAFNETGDVLTLTVQNTQYRWIVGTAGVLAGAGLVTWDDTAAPTGKRLTIGAGGGGVYLITATFAGNLQKHADLSMDVFKNASAAQNITCDFHVAEDGAYVAGTASGLLELVADDTVTMWFSASIGTNAFTVKHANVTLLRVG